MAAEEAGSAWERAVQALRADATRQSLVRDGYYDDPARDSAERYRNSDEWRAIRQLLPPAPRRVLDIGAGRGIASYALARDGYQVCALEPDPGSLVGAAAIRELARVTATSIDVSEAHSESLPYPAQSFDVIFARAVLHHARDLQALCREVNRVLRPGGRFIAVREHVISRAEDLPAFLEAHPLHRLYGGEHAYTLGEYRAAIRAAGLALERVLAPLTSAINYAPYTPATLRRELARLASRGIPGLETVIATLLQIPGAWALLRPAVQYLDDRPGRLYSFVASKP